MSAHAKVTILVDNQSGEGLVSEHGLSLWIETAGRRLLFDTGQGSALQNNAQKLGIRLDETDILVLSHGHFDHTGGVSQVYCHPAAVQPRYSIRNGKPKPIQMPSESMSAIDKLPLEQIHWIQQPISLNDTIGITGPIPRETNFEDTGGPFYLDPQGKCADPIDDDLALWIRTDDGLVVCVGCSHAGAVNTLNDVCRLTGQNRIRAVIGGFHLLNANNRRLDLTVAALRSFSPGMVIPCHCTGERGVKAFQDAFDGRVIPGCTGMSFRW
jgi:7,8-dihydropterin-6-yl-methyl-4-(beta-D-ribofuranosyl)aminobenzene 5'-phosphate synthase